MQGRTSVVLPYNFSKFFFGVRVERYPQEGFAHPCNAPVMINCNDSVHGPTGFEVAHYNGLPVGVVSVLYLCSCLKLHASIKPQIAAKVKSKIQEVIHNVRIRIIRVRTISEAPAPAASTVKQKV